MNIIKSQNPEEINVHKQIWGENAEEVIYAGRNNKYKVAEDDKRCPFCDSRIEELEYCAFVVI